MPLSAKEQALVATANAKAKARDPKAFVSNLPKDTRPSKGSTVTAKQIPSAPAQGATEKAPHTKRAIIQNKEEAKVTAAEAKVTAAKVEVTRTTAIATKSKRTDPERTAKFLAKTNAELALIAANRALRALKHDPDASAAKKVAEPKAPRAARTPKVAVNRTYKPGPNKYENAKGGWTLYMVTTALAHKTTDDATAAHKSNKQGQPAAKPLDFKWMDAKGYIKLA